MSPTYPGHFRWREGPRQPGPTVLFDLDGVLSDATNRQHFLKDEGGTRDWRGFFDACGQDTLIEEVARLLELLDDELVVVLLTGRPLRVQPNTLEWLDRHQLRWDLLVMRPGGEYALARQFKQGAVHDLRSQGFDLRLAFEDDLNNREMFHAEGVPCVYIHSGYYD